MLDTVKEHPVPAFIAGLSIGYLLMKSGEESPRRDYGDRRSRRYRADAYGSAYDRGRAYDPEAYADDLYEPGYGPYARGETRAYEFEDGNDDRSMRENISEKAGAVKHRAGEVAHEAQEQMHAAGRHARERAQAAGRQVRYGARRTRSEMEVFIHENPLAAGAIALGLGALVGALLPSTEQEDAWMGPARDEVVHRAEEAGRETMHQAQHVAERVADEAKHAVKDAKEDLKHVAETAVEGAREVKDEARHQVQEKIRT